MTARRVRPTLKAAAEWIARNDSSGDAGAGDVEEVSGLVSVVLVADLFGVSADKVARWVVRVRREEGIV